MTIKSWLKDSTDKLNQAGIATARLDCLVLLEDELKKDKAWLLAHDHISISPSVQTKLNNLLTQRMRHIPLAYLRGMTEFYGRNFVITPAVLEPRPESETMIDLLKDISSNGLIGGKPARILDVGCGSGALAVTAQMELEQAQVKALDIDSKVLKVAKTNVDLFTLNISVFKSDLLDKAAENYDILLCNLPYVPDDFKINLAALHEPKKAIYGGPDGLDLYRKLFYQLNNMSFRPLYILCESLPTQHQALAAIAKDRDYLISKTEDFIQVFKLASK